MKVMFMGTPEIAACCLERLAARHEIVCVVTRIDKPKGRGGAVSASAVKMRARQLGISVEQPRTLKDGSFAETLGKYRPDVIVVVAYGLILPKYVLDFPHCGCVNLHVSLLPKYRGAAPIQWCIANGETAGGVTTMLMDEGVDTGHILLSAEVGITPQMTGGQLHDIYCEEGAKLLCGTLDDMEAGVVTPRKQEGEASYAPMLTNENTWIQWFAPIKTIINLTRAMDPCPGAYTYLDGKKLRIFSLSPASDTLPAGKTPGSIIPDKSRLLVVCGDGVASVEELQLEGKKRMPAADFLRGYKIINEEFTLKGTRGMRNEE